MSAMTPFPLVSAFALLAVLVGTTLLVTSLPVVQHICRRTQEHQLGWRVLQILVAFFVAGYLSFAFLLLQSPGSQTELLVGLVFVGGAAFVLIVVHMSRTTIEKVLAIAERERHRALHDELTGLPNRTLLLERMVYSIAIAKRSTKPFAVLLMDLDQFKRVNDTLGHGCGDEVLKQAAPRLIKIMRESDTVARLGGDEFAALLRDAGLAQAIVVAEKIVQAMEHPFTIQGRQIKIGISIGISVFPTHSMDPDILLQRADIAMYVAKRKDFADVSYATYTIDQDKNTLENLTLIAELRDAIRYDQMMLLYQPKRAATNGRICGVEALVRWNHPKLGLIPPARFIPLAEQTGYISALTRWVLVSALRQHMAWRQEGLHVPVAANISSKDLRDLLFPQFVADQLQKLGIDPANLTLEITESSMMIDPERTVKIIERLGELGVNLSIDDFGTGYSSLHQLKWLPAGEIKIDRTFIKDMIQDENDAAIVRSTIELAHNMGRRVVAEGVESKEVLDVLKLLNCDDVQGYYFSRPVAAAEITELVRAEIAAPSDQGDRAA